MLCCLRRSATSNKDGIVVPIGSARPKEVIIGAAFLLVLPEASVLFKAIYRPWIRVAIVEVPDLFRYIH
jgi:hypothetical protein